MAGPIPNLIPGYNSCNASVKASAYRGKSKKYVPLNLIDGNKETYWATDDEENTGRFEIDFGKPQTVSYVLLQEYIKLGQRIKSFSIDAWKDNKWHQISEGTTIGYKRIVKVDPVTTQKIRVNILDSKACPVLSNVEVY
jgi:alpha-L-fucosidase